MFVIFIKMIIYNHYQDNYDDHHDYDHDQGQFLVYPTRLARFSEFEEAGG